jgi:hypothetical protein
MNDRFGRRRLLQLGGFAGIATLAGCVGGDGSGDGGENESQDGNESESGNQSGNGGQNGSEDGAEQQPDTEIDANATLEVGEIPAFTEFVSATDAPKVAYTSQPGTNAFQFVPVPVDTVPTFLGDVQAVGLASEFTLNIFLNSFGLGGLAGTDSEFETTVEEMMLVNSAYVLHGEIDTEEIGQRVQTTSNRDEDSRSQATLEPDGEFGEYTMYAAPDGSKPTPQGNLPVAYGDTVDAMAVTESTLVIGSRDGVESKIEASRGDQTRATDEYTPFAWLTSVGSDADTVYATYDSGGLPALTPSLSELTSEEAAPVNDATGRGASLTFGEDTVEVEVGLVFDQPLSAEKRAAIAALPRADVQNATLEVDGASALLTVTYDSATVTQ